MPVRQADWVPGCRRRVPASPGTMRGSGACASWSILMVVIVVAIVGRHCSGRGLRNRRRVHVAHAIGVAMCGATLRDRNAGRWKGAGAEKRRGGKEGVRK